MRIHLAFFLLSTFAFPDLAPKLLGENTKVGEDFGREADLGHLRIDQDEDDLEAAREDEGGDQEQEAGSTGGGRQQLRGAGEREPLLGKAK